MCRCFDSSCLWWTLDLCWNNPLCCLTKPEFWLVSRSNSVYNSGFPSNHHIIQFIFPYFPVIKRIPLQRFLFSGSLGLRVWTEDGKISVRLGSSHRPVIAIFQDAKKMWRWCFSPIFPMFSIIFPYFTLVSNIFQLGMGAISVRGDPTWSPKMSKSHFSEKNQRDPTGKSPISPHKTK